MEKLKVGDKVCLVQRRKFGSGTSYSFSEVERLTNTQAVLKNGIKLVNEPKTTGFAFNNENAVCYSVYGDSWTKWQLTTPGIIQLAKDENKRIKISNWFSEQKFTDEQKEIIFDLFTKKE
jgi:hypothetical protein